MSTHPWEFTRISAKAGSLPRATDRIWPAIQRWWPLEKTGLDYYRETGTWSGNERFRTHIRLAGLFKPLIVHTRNCTGRYAEGS